MLVFDEMQDIFLDKKVYQCYCKYCDSILTRRAIAAIRLSDRKELCSTDKLVSVARMGKDQQIDMDCCSCVIYATGCTTCGNKVGYSVANACRKCLRQAHKMDILIC